MLTTEDWPIRMSPCKSTGQSECVHITVVLNGQLHQALNVNACMMYEQIFYLRLMYEYKIQCTMGLNYIMWYKFYEISF